MGTCHTGPPVLEPSEHDLDAVAAIVATFVVFHSRLALLSAWDAWAYPFVLQRFSEPIGIIAAISEHPVYVRQTAQKRPRANVVADLPSRDEVVDWASLAIADGMQLGIHTALGPPYQAPTPPFVTPMPVAARWAFR